jgi:hypothetical protein
VIHGLMLVFRLTEERHLLVDRLQVIVVLQRGSSVSCLDRKRGETHRVVGTVGTVIHRECKRVGRLTASDIGLESSQLGCRAPTLSPPAGRIGVRAAG